MMNFYSGLLRCALGVSAVLILLCVIRAVRGPHTADRLMAVNMITTLVTACICMLAVLLAQGWLVDAALILCLLGGLAVIVLTRTLISPRHPAEGKEENPRVE